MTHLIAFDTSAAHCAAALLSGDRIVAHRRVEMARGQAEALMPLLDALLADAGCGWRALDAIGVGIGPGNFTGTRISVSAARGLSLSLGIPAIGVSGFAALAEGPDADLVALPAPRDMVYLRRILDGQEHGEPVQVALDNLPDWRVRHVIGHKAQDLAAAFRADHATPRELSEIAPGIAHCAARRLPDASRAPHDRPAPLYLRPADAAPPREAPPVILE